MSYILDALRKADAERERDPARGIHAQPAVASAAHAPARVPRWAWGAGLVALAVAGMLALTAREAPPPRGAAGTAGATAPLASVAVVAAPVPAVVPVASTVLPPPAALPPAPAAPPRAPARVVAVAKVPAPVASPAAGAGASSTPGSGASAASAGGTGGLASTRATGAPVPVAADRVLAYSELPADVQRDLPKLAITGGVHSQNASQRMLIVGGQVMAEGAELAPGVVLEQIRTKSAVLRFRGLRYSVVY